MSDNQHGRQRTPIESSEQVASALSHDFRSSARQIKSFTQLLEAHLGENADSETKEYLKVLTSAADVLQTKLEALDRFSAKSAGPLRIRQWTVREIVESAVVAIANELEEVGAVLDIDTSSDSLASVSADREQLTSVFVEVIRNSLTFCQRPAQIAIRSSREEAGVVVIVTDSGPGFQAQDYERPFDLFRRFHLQDYPGTGTGLAIVRRILERHGADVTIQSDPTSGTTVRFTFDAIEAPA